MAKVVMGARKKELGAWRKKGGEDRVREKAAAPSEANKARGRLEERPYLRAFCAVRKRAHILQFFQRNAYALPSFSHFSHLVAHA